MLSSYGTDWKEVKEQRLKDASTHMTRVKLAITRADRLYREIMRTFPKEVNAQLWIGYNGYDATATIVFSTTAPPVETALARRFLTHRYHKAERTFDEYSGAFSWCAEMKRKDRKGEYVEGIRIQNTNPGKCKILKYTETVTKFKTDCKGDGSEQVK